MIDRKGKGGRGKKLLYVEATSGADDKEPTPLDRLIKELGGGGRCKVFRVVDGEPAYAFTAHVDDGFADSLEETLAKRVGGGQFCLRFYNEEGYVPPQINLSIDASVNPQVKTPRESARAGGELGEPSTMFEMMRVMESRMDAKIERVIAASSRPAIDPVQLLTFMQRSTLEMATVLRGGATSTPPTTVIEQLQQLKATVDVMQGLNLGGADASSRSMTERVLENPLMKIGERVGDRLADLMVPKPTPAAPTQAPAAQPVKQQLEAQTKGQPVQPPATAQRISPEVAESIRKGRGWVPATPPAPKVAEVKPHLVEAKKTA